LKAFSIVFHVSVYTKGISVLNLSKLVSVSQKSVWLIKRKIQEAMAPCDTEKMQENDECKLRNVDGVILTHRPEDFNGLQNAKLMIFENQGLHNKRILKRVEVLSGRTKTDCQLIAGRYVKDGKDILMWNFRNWLSGVHHHCADKYLQGYFDEFRFRFNHRFQKKQIWHILMERLIKAEPYIYKRNAAKS
jgi:hypothetical protein